MSKYFVASTKQNNIGTLYFLFGIFSGVIGTVLSLLIRLEVSHIHKNFSPLDFFTAFEGHIEYIFVTKFFFIVILWFLFSIKKNNLNFLIKFNNFLFFQSKEIDRQTVLGNLKKSIDEINCQITQKNNDLISQYGYCRGYKKIKESLENDLLEKKFEILNNIDIELLYWKKEFFAWYNIKGMNVVYYLGKRSVECWRYWGEHVPKFRRQTSGYDYNFGTAKWDKLAQEISSKQYDIQNHISWLTNQKQFINQTFDNYIVLKNREINDAFSGCGCDISIFDIFYYFCFFNFLIIIVLIILWFFFSQMCFSFAYYFLPAYNQYTHVEPTPVPFKFFTTEVKEIWLEFKDDLKERFERLETSDNTFVLLLFITGLCFVLFSILLVLWW